MQYHDELARIGEAGVAMAHEDAAVADAQPFFNDSLKTVRDRERLAAYLAESATAVDKCSVAIDEWTPARIGWYVRWRMTIRFRRFRRGVDTESIGISHIVFDRDGRVALHQDFRDAAGGLYEHIPFLGGLIRRIRQRL